MMRANVRLAVLLAPLLSACTDKEPEAAAGCGEATCAAGEVCLGQVCRKLCGGDAECGEGMTCERDVCLPGPNQSVAPTITAVDSDGDADGAGGHAALHLARRLIVSGENLALATVTLTSASGVRTLERCELPTERRLVLALPDDLTAQTYTLTAANQAGSCSATLPILQGEPGRLDATGSQIVATINTALEADPSLRVGGYVGANLLANPHFTQQTNLMPSFWTIGVDGTTAPNLVDVSADAPAGPLAIENGAGTRLTLTSTAQRLLNHGATYSVEGSLRDVSTSGTTGKAVLGVRLYDRGGGEIRGAGESGFWLEVMNTTPPSTWTRYALAFGAGTARPFPAEAQKMTVAVMLNTDPSGIGNRSLRAQGLSLAEDTGRKVKPWFIAAGATGSDWVAGSAGAWTYVTGLADVRGSAASSYNPTNGRFTAPETGLYQCGLQAYKSFAEAGYHHSISTCFSPPSGAERICNAFGNWDYTIGGQGSGGYDDSTDRNTGLIYLLAGEQIAYRIFQDVANPYAYHRPHSRMWCAKLSD